MILLDLFSGIGGFHLGLKWAGFKFDKVFYSDIDDYANKVYKKNFPEAIPLGDITKINPETLPKIDIITGGFPCQDISYAGKQKGIEGERSGLFGEIIRITSVVRPKIIFMENVRNLLSGGGGEWMLTVLSAINEIGYNAEWEVISASSQGAPHRRERVWIVAYAKGEPGNGSGNAPSREMFKQGLWSFKSGGQGMRGACKEWNINERHILKSAICRKNDGIPHRVDRLKCLGNAVVPQVVQLIGEMILDSGLLDD